MRHATIESKKGNTIARESRLDEVKEGRKLREHDSLDVRVFATEPLEVGEETVNLGRLVAADAAE